MFKFNIGGKRGNDVSIRKFAEGVAAEQGDGCKAIAMTVVCDNGKTYTAAIGRSRIGIDPESVMMAMAMREFLEEELQVGDALARQLKENGSMKTESGCKVVPLASEAECPGIVDFAERVEREFRKHMKDV